LNGPERRIPEEEKPKKKLKGVESKTRHSGKFSLPGAKTKFKRNLRAEAGKESNSRDSEGSTS